MNTLDDLRASLHAHADGLDPLDPTTRTAQVHGRVRAVRRRRTAAGAVAAVLAVLAAGGVAFLPSDRSPEPAGPVPVPDRLVGHDVPETIEAAGWTYEYVRSVTGDDRVEVTLEASDEPRVIAWATADPADEGRWKVQADQQSHPATATDFSHYSWVEPGVPGHVSLAGEGEAALAVYELSEERPPGVTVEGLTFREQVAGDRLLAADAVRGESSLTMRLEVPEGTIRLGGLCSGTDDGVGLDIALDGEVLTSRGACDSGTVFDPGASWFAALTSEDSGYEPGDVVDVEVRLTDGDGDPVEVDDAALLAASVYAVARTDVQVAGQPVPEVLEVDGATWTLERTVEEEPGRPVVESSRETEPALVVVHFSGAPKDRVLFTAVDGERTGTSFQGPGSGSGGPFFLPGEATVTVDVEGGLGPRTRVGFAVYTRFVPQM